ncbi:unnamed protein product [Adineta ricciae]|uniref:Uncharacterized protein n=1 Tax=Adineta ricciae TaxID=249248 RepID=A0A814NXY5_ADIRI|nr:unnamed protein product [Adineta ricciae]CAF1098521.1 unnamed protein product [Adineta ricciae]
MKYIYDLNARNCTRRPLTRPWHDFDIRPDAQSYGQAYIGTGMIPELDVLVSLCFVHRSGDCTSPSNDTVREFGSWTYLHCFPLNIVRYSHNYRRSQITFLDITPNISDPNVFVPRKERLTKEQYSLRDILFGKLS